MISSIYFLRQGDRSAPVCSVEKSILETLLECVVLAGLGLSLYLLYGAKASLIGKVVMIAAPTAAAVGIIALYARVHRAQIAASSKPPSHNPFQSSVTEAIDTSRTQPTDEIRLPPPIEKNAKPPKTRRMLQINQANYSAETVLLQFEGESCYFYGRSITPVYTDWQNHTSTQKPEEKESFQDFFNGVIQASVLLRENFRKNKLRLFTQEEREKLAISFENGKLLQIGLDQEGPLKPLEKGAYIFVLNKEAGEKRKLYITKKSETSQGKVQHSSFFHGQPVENAGMFVIDDQGDLKLVCMHSGHFLPTQEDLENIKKFLGKHLGARAVSQCKFEMPLRT